jgi:hypothetical protein
VKGGEAYRLVHPDPLLGDRQPARVEIYRMGPTLARVRCIADGAPVPCPLVTMYDWWAVRPLNDGRAPAGWQLAGLARPYASTHEGHDLWRVPGPPWGGDLLWTGPGQPLMLRGAGPRPGWGGPVIGPVTGPCQTLPEAQAAADAWWLAEVAGHVTRGEGNGQESLFGAPA